MPTVDLHTFRCPISSDSPSGANLEYDQRFVEMLRLGEGTREQQYGNTIVAAQAPEYRTIDQLAADLASETRDLRIAVLLLESRTHTNGLDGLAEGMELLRDWVCQYWDDVYPQLDESDGDDPFVRINSLGRLCEPERLPRLIMQIPLVEASPHILVTLADACGMKVPSEKKSDSGGGHHADRPTAMEVEAAFLSLSLSETRSRYETSERIRSALVETIDFLEQSAGKGIWDARILLDLIDQCTNYLKSRLRGRLSVSDAVVADVTSESDSRQGSSAATAWNSEDVDRSISSLSRIRVDSRDEAAYLIEAVTRYFERQEPSSPVPLLLRRAKRLINQDFVDIVRDLAPDALVQARNLVGESDRDS